MESFDSLWFFSNVLTLTNKLQGQYPHRPAASAIDEDIVKQEEEASEDKISSEQTAYSLQNEGSGSEILGPRCFKCGEIAGGIEEQQQVEWVEGAKPTDDEKVERRRKKKKKKMRRKLRSKRKVLGELDLGLGLGLGLYDHYYAMSDLATTTESTETNWFCEELTKGKGHGFPSFGRQHQRQQYCRKMPPLNDGLAMKQHLKSWAHAVACTVR